MRRERYARRNAGMAAWKAALLAQGEDRVDLGGAAGGEHGGGDRDEQEDQDRDGPGGWIEGGDLKELGAQESRKRQRRGDAEGEAGACEPEALDDDETADARGRGAEGDADADLAA